MKELHDAKHETWIMDIGWTFRDMFSNKLTTWSDDALCNLLKCHEGID